MKKFLGKVTDTLYSYVMIQEGDVVVAACSGGPDSMALLYFLVGFSKKINFSLIVAHLNHLLRGEESEADAALVKKFAEKYSLPFFYKESSVKSIAKKKKLSLEEAARGARYQFFDEVMGEVKANKLALGHTQDDQVETFFIRLIRGAGPEGLAGIRYVRQAKGFVIVRPMLDVSKEEILDYIESNAIPYRLDSSNLDYKFLRNRIRLGLIPLLEKDYNTGIRKNVLKVMENLSFYNGFVKNEINRCYEQMVFFKDGKVLVELSEFLALPEYLQQEVVKKVLYVLVDDIKQENIEDVLKLARKLASGKRIELKNDLLVIKEYGKIIFCRESELPSAFKDLLNIPGETEALEGKIFIKSQVLVAETFGKIPVEPIKGDIRKEEKSVFRECFDYGLLKNRSLMVRSREPGERFKSLGFPFHKKVKEIFIDEKFPVSLRNRVPVIADSQGEIVWIVGYQISDMFKITQETKEVLVVDVEVDFS